MYFEEPIRRWQIAKYKQIKRDNRSEEPVSLVLDLNKKRVQVYFYEEELEQVYYNMEVSKFPYFRFSDHYLYVLFNGQGQGFRLTFAPDQKMEFMGIMRNVAYITESPAKRTLFPDSARMEPGWPPRQRVNQFSASQPTCSSMPPPKRPAARNLSTLHFTAPNRPSSSSSRSSLSSPFSFSRPESSSSTSSSRASWASGMSRPESQASRSSSRASWAASQASQASFGSQDLFGAVEPPVTPKETANKCIQTNFKDILMDQMAQDADFSMACLMAVMEHQKFGDLVQNMRELIKQMPKEKLQEFEKNTRPPKPKCVATRMINLDGTSQAIDNSCTQSTSSSVPSTQKMLKKAKTPKKPGLLRRETSDLEYDVFEGRK